MVEQKLGRVERRRREARGALVAAGQKLFAIRSIEAVTIDSIADAADVAKGSFYTHFQDKEALASAIVERIHADFENEILQANVGIIDPAEAMARALCVILAYAMEHPDRVQAMLNLTTQRLFVGEPLNANLVKHLSVGIEAGAFPDITIEVGLVVVVGIARAVIEYTAFAETGKPQVKHALESVAALLRALGVPRKKSNSLAKSAVENILT